MKKLRKFLALSFAVIMLLSAFSGCKKPENPSSSMPEFIYGPTYSKFNLPEGTQWINYVAVSGDKMPLVYALTDIYVQPTLVPESFGRSIAEAQAMGRIVIAANHGGACELIVNGRTGFLTPVGDSQKMAAMLDTVLALSDEEKNEIGQKATESVRTNFSIQKMCDRTVAVYKEILGNEIDYK